MVVAHHGSEHPFGITAVAGALALGLPVVTTAGPAVDLRVAQIGAGLVVPPYDPQALAAALYRLLADTLLAQRMEAAGRLHCAQHCNPRAGAAKLVAALAALHDARGAQA